ncbi:MAG: arginine repressor [Bacteroidetes bacterium]|nr:arginine repressor [Bacteroidota bacterium]
MNNKQLRKVRVKEMIRDNIISSQDDLLKLLRDEGFSLTQATLSRDLKKMKISKVAYTDNTYRYIIPKDSPSKPKSGNRGFVSLEFSGHMAVVRTLAGYASPMAVLMDNSPSDLFTGTIAGRDTIFVALNEKNMDREKFKIYLENLLSDNED